VNAALRASGPPGGRVRAFDLWCLATPGMPSPRRCTTPLTLAQSCGPEAARRTVTLFLESLFPEGLFPERLFPACLPPARPRLISGMEQGANAVSRSEMAVSRPAQCFT